MTSLRASALNLITHATTSGTKITNLTQTSNLKKTIPNNTNHKNYYTTVLATITTAILTNNLYNDRINLTDLDLDSSPRHNRLTSKTTTTITATKQQQH